MLPFSMFSIKELLLEDGSSPFGNWFLKLDTQAAVKVQVALARMEQGNLSNVKWFRGIGEYKINWGPGIRIYFAKDGLNIILLLAGGDKSSQQKDIEIDNFYNYIIEIIDKIIEEYNSGKTILFHCLAGNQRSALNNSSNGTANDQFYRHIYKNILR